MDVLIPFGIIRIGFKAQQIKQFNECKLWEWEGIFDKKEIFQNCQKYQLL